MPFPPMLGRPVSLRPGALPKFVRYHFATDDAVNRFDDFLSRHLGAPNADGPPLFGHFAFVLPGAWQTFREAGLDLTAQKKSKVIDGKAVSDLSIRPGVYLIRNPAEIHAMETKLAALLSSDGGYSVRALTSEEMELWWSFIGFDIREPVFVAESEGRHYHFVIAGNGSHAYLIDELNSLWSMLQKRAREASVTEK